MTRQRTLTFALAAAVVLVATSGFAAKLKIGDAAPKWSGIIGVDGKKHSLSDYKEAKLIALVFTCNHCPVAKDYEERLIAIQKDYKSKGVQVIAVSVNDPEAYREDSFENMKKRAAGEGLGRWRTTKEPFNFPYLYDETQKIGRDYGATSTPHVFVLDQKRMIAYMGSVDDSQNLKRVKVRYLRNALDYLGAGNSPVTKEFGCSIKWKTEKK